MSKRKAIVIGWFIVIVSIIIAFIISLRETIFNGQSLDQKNFITIIIMAGAVIVGYAIATSVGNKR